MIWIGVLIVMLGGMLALHWHDHTMRWFWRGLAFFVGWAVFLAFVPGGLNMAWWWLVLDAPLNFGWMLCWAWPFLAGSWTRDKENWRILKSQISYLRQVTREARAQRKSL